MFINASSVQSPFDDYAELMDFTTIIYSLSLFNTILIILFVAICIVLCVGATVRFARIRAIIEDAAKKCKHKCQLHVDNILQLRQLEAWVTEPGDQNLWRKQRIEVCCMSTIFNLNLFTILKRPITDVIIWLDF
ncbi:unnamed protein product [Gongylonema pulchrum]|uniref:Col_cuticle_N domain-containing protein n=1 Tax=Gongylonema pulchrum TaxID=637853 RepID=A0A183D743_9BILA|nr:unnamed protein product [Gongylonema pulchrum]